MAFCVTDDILIHVRFGELYLNLKKNCEPKLIKRSSSIAEGPHDAFCES